MVLFVVLFWSHSSDPVRGEGALRMKRALTPRNLASAIACGYLPTAGPTHRRIAAVVDGDLIVQTRSRNRHDHTDLLAGGTNDRKLRPGRRARTSGPSVFELDSHHRGRVIYQGPAGHHHRHALVFINVRFKRHLSGHPGRLMVPPEVAILPIA